MLYVRDRAHAELDSFGATKTSSIADSASALSSSSGMASARTRTACIGSEWCVASRTVNLTAQSFYLDGLPNDSTGDAAAATIDRAPLLPRILPDLSWEDDGVPGALAAELTQLILEGMAEEEVTCPNVSHLTSLFVQLFDSDKHRLMLMLVLPLLPYFTRQLVDRLFPAACTTPPRPGEDANDVYLKLLGMLKTDVSKLSQGSIALRGRVEVISALQPSSTLPKLICRSFENSERLGIITLYHIGRTSEKRSSARKGHDMDESISAPAQDLRPWSSGLQLSVDGSGRYYMRRFLRQPHLADCKSLELIGMCALRSGLGATNALYEGVATSGLQTGFVELADALNAMAGASM